MTLTYLADLSRVRIEVTDVPGTAALIERSTDLIRWQIVRGGEAVTLTGGACTLDDYEFVPGVANHYRASRASPTVELPAAGTVVTAGGGVAVDADFTVDAFTLASRMVRLDLTVDNFDNLEDLSLFVGKGTPFITNNIRWRFDAKTAASAIGKSGQRFQIDLKLAEINTTSGTITLSSTGLPSDTDAMTGLKLRVEDTGVAPVTVQLHGVTIVPLDTNQGFVSITFDDGHASVASLAKPKMDVLGFVGTHYTIVESIGNLDRVTLADLQAMDAAGWEIGGHAFASAVHTASYEEITRAEAEEDLSSLRDWLVGNFPDPEDRHSFAYPHGRYGDTTDAAAIEQLVKAAGFASGRTIVADPGVPTHAQIAAVPEVMPYRIHAMSSISELSSDQQNPANLIATGGMLDKTASNDGWMILVFHRITAGPATVTSECSQADFDAIMDAIAARNLRVATVRDVLDLQHGVITPAIDQIWLKSITRPFLNRPVQVRDYSPIGRAARNGVFEVVGRSFPVAVTDVRGSKRYVLSVNTLTLDEAEEFDLILASGDPVFLQVPADDAFPLPGVLMKSLYAVVGDTEEARLGFDGRRVFTLPLTEVAPPHHTIVGTTVTWASVINAYATWADVIADNPTWADLLDRIGDPIDVLVP